MGERRIAVAYSGGRDSTALLHATLEVAAEHHVAVIALHVHHGLNTAADAWLAHCMRQCEHWKDEGRPITLVAERIITRPGRGDSVEAWARDVRYAALRRLAVAERAGTVLLAHHRRDQAETLLLQALRGGGVAGLAGMPRSVERDGILWQRPWLGKSREAIDAYVQDHRLEYIDDTSNADPRFARNRLRQEVWPSLTGAFAQAESSLATAAEWAQQADAILAEVAALDLARVAHDGGLRVEAWLHLSAPRRSNVLRVWLKREQGVAAPASLVTRLQNELPSTQNARWPVGGNELRLYRGILRIDRPAAVPVGREAHLSIRRAGLHKLPGWSGHLHVTRVREDGVPLAWLARLDLLPRSGGERFQAGPGRPPRSLKKQYQQAGVSPSCREGPLVYSGGQLVYVPGLGLDARVLGLPGQAMVTLAWVPRVDGAGAGQATPQS